MANPAALHSGRSAAPERGLVTGSEAIPASAVKNGTTPFAVTTNPPATPIAGAPDCPNPQWTEAITDLAFTSATITVDQPAGTLVLTGSCTFKSRHRTDRCPAAA